MKNLSRWWTAALLALTAMMLACRETGEGSSEGRDGAFADRRFVDGAVIDAAHATGLDAFLVDAGAVEMGAVDAAAAVVVDAALADAMEVVDATLVVFDAVAEVDAQPVDARLGDAVVDAAVVDAAMADAAMADAAMADAAMVDAALDALGDAAPSTCGNGQIEVGEECDDQNFIDGDRCSNACRRPVCGDGIHQINEPCDDGNPSNLDACLNTCQRARCGDGFVQEGMELCDDGNAIDLDGCRRTCTPDEPIPIAAPGEVVRWGGALSFDAPLWASPQLDCSASQGRVPHLAYRIVNSTGAPQHVTITAIWPGVSGRLYILQDAFDPQAPAGSCIAGNANRITHIDIAAGQVLVVVVSGLAMGDFALELLTEAGCGDGVVVPGEACDDGNQRGGDACAADCTWEPATPIAARAGRIRLAGALEADDPRWARPEPDCMPSPPADHPYDAFRIVNNTGAPQLVHVIADWAPEAGYLNVFTDRFAALPLQGCLLGAAREHNQVFINANQVLVVVASTASGNVNLGDYVIEVITQDQSCGDGFEWSWDGEECDDGNQLEGDGCTADCQRRCIDDWDCGGEEVTCIDGECRPWECGDVLIGDRCMAGTVCRGHFCTPINRENCQDNLDCGRDVCVDHTCVPTCQDSLDCPEAETCSRQICVPDEGEDPCEAAVPIDGPGIYGGTLAGVSHRRASCDGGGERTEVVYALAMPEAGTVCLDAAGAFEPDEVVVHVRAGECTEGPEAACGYGPVTLNAEVGLYFVYVDGHGDYVLTVSDGPCLLPPCQDHEDCAGVALCVDGFCHR